MIHLLCGIGTILFIMYIRLIMERLPRDLSLYYFDYWGIKRLNIFLTSFAIFWVIISASIVYISLRYILLKPIRIGYTMGNILDIFIATYNFLRESLISVAYIINDSLYDTYNAISNFAAFFYKYFGHRREDIFLIVTYIIRFIILLAFLIDVFLFFRLNYFYKTLTLLCVNLVIHLFHFLLEDYSSCLKEIETELVITKSTNENGEPVTNFERAPGNEEIDLLYSFREYGRCLKIKGYLEIYDAQAKKYNSRVNLVIYFLYMSGWLYVLIRGLW